MVGNVHNQSLTKMLIKLVRGKNTVPVSRLYTVQINNFRHFSVGSVAAKKKNPWGIQRGAGSQCK
jgi:hypothetical protein